MENNSTSKMLTSMASKKKSTVGITAAAELDRNDYFSAPQLTPEPDMSNTLSNILGSNSKKEYNPMD